MLAFAVVTLCELSLVALEGVVEGGTWLWAPRLERAGKKTVLRYVATFAGLAVANCEAVQGEGGFLAPPMRGVRLLNVTLWGRWGGGGGCPNRGLDMRCAWLG